MKKKLWIRFAFFVAIGAILGYGYYYFIGCRTGTCPLTSNPLISTLYGSFFGGVLGMDSRLFRKQKES